MREPRSLFVDLHAGRFHYLDFGGEGLPALVLLHGTGFHAWLWASYGERLASRFHVYALDQRGHGDSTAEPADYGSSQFAGDLLEFFDRLSIQRPFCVGHSMGGTVIVVAEHTRPGSVGGAVLIDPILMQPRFYQGDWRLESEPMSRRTLRRRAVWPSHEAMIESYGARLPFRTWQDEQLRLYVEHGTWPAADGQVELKCSPEIEARCYLHGHSFDPWPAVRSFAPPALVLRGTVDENEGLQRATESAGAMARGELIEVPGRTHFLPMEDPEEVLRHVLAFADRMQ